MPAHAAPGDLTCGLTTLTITLSPPLTPTNHKTKATGTGSLSACVSLNGVHSDLKSASITGTGNAEFAAPVNASIKGTADFTWNTGEVSKFTFEVNSDPLNPKFSAKVTEGPLAGDTSGGSPAIWLPDVDPLTGSLKGFTVIAAGASFN
ncbi:hypothetical protein [Streptomyces sp. NPDC051577]|uniref:hypothetical protein n=1 Tax=Streptomyces sp. NPDC051577 TaxID=3155166 RepID=UPI00342137C2